jgi:hypothetical protein
MSPDTDPRKAEPPASPVAIAAAVAIAVTIPLIVWMFLSRTASSRTIDRLYAQIAGRDQEIRALRAAGIALRATLDQPQIGTPVELDAANSTEVVVPPGARTFTVTIHPAARAFELRDAQGQLMWRGEAADVAVAVTFPREVLKPGDYALRANGAEYRFTVKSD